MFFCLSLPVHSGSLKRIDYPKQLSGPPSFFLNVSTALKETHNYIFIGSEGRTLVLVIAYFNLSKLTSPEHFFCSDCIDLFVHIFFSPFSETDNNDFIVLV